MASSVEKRMALTLPVFSLERFTLETPTFAESSLRDIFRSAMTRSRRRMMGIRQPPLQGLVGQLLQLFAVLEDVAQQEEHDADHHKGEVNVEVGGDVDDGAVDQQAGQVHQEYHHGLFRKGQDIEQDAQDHGVFTQLPEILRDGAVEGGAFLHGLENGTDAVHTLAAEESADKAQRHGNGGLDPHEPVGGSGLGGKLQIQESHIQGVVAGAHSVGVQVEEEAGADDGDTDDGGHHKDSQDDVRHLEEGVQFLGNGSKLFHCKNNYLRNP